MMYVHFVWIMEKYLIDTKKNKADLLPMQTRKGAKRKIGSLDQIASIAEEKLYILLSVGDTTKLN